ncbi:PTS sugar transporter subunit IIA [Candidatus Enterococcus ferrettii]|uniref:PTS EIIA type-2 domain-containing protein n=1 Tax=Candidatus Enterococcus ferrettii TaxID=2815324 RepID=A0ABV0EM40_9ENTE|nr:PTS sugar transporter subunit IIA [Enterococcus sp. 665A]MBO1338472.1 PTS sugar transporter subunit IIA [Enterococcus sp. 665A]
MGYKEMFDPRLIDLEVEATSEEEAFGIVATRLKEAGMVNDGYFNGISQREQRFPTGLITQHLNIGLPHSDPEFVEKPFIFVCRLKNQVGCCQMGDNQEMQVKDLFFLGISDGKNQVGLLQAFMNLFMDESFVKAYREAEEANTVYQLFVENI